MSNGFSLIVLCCFGLFLAKSNGQAFNDYDNFPHDYSNAKLKDPMSLLLDKVSDGKVDLVESNDYKLLENLLDELDIDNESQVLVFSKTSLQKAAVSLKNPRAIYFNDEVYLGWMPGGELKLPARIPKEDLFFTFNDQ